MYTPNNDCVYNKSFAGCLAGLGGSGPYLDPVLGDTSGYARMADAYAQEFDTVWGVPAPTAFEEDAIQEASSVVWAARSPLESAKAFIPGSYNGIVKGVIARVQEGNAQIVAEGIDPNGCSPGGGFTPPAGAEGDLLVFHTGAWQTVIPPGPAGTILTSVGLATVPVYAFPSRTPLGPIAFIDPGNISGFASDNNTGATANNVPPGSGPILTTGHLNTLLYTKELATGGVDRTIHYMSPDPGNIELEYSTMSLGGSNLFFTGTPQVQHTGGTLNAGTITINPAAAGGGQRQVFHTTDIVDWAAFVAQPPGTSNDGAYLQDLTAPRNGNFAWIMSGAGSATASATRPTDPTATVAGSINSGDAYNICTGSRLNVAAGCFPVSDGGSVFFTDFAFDISHLGGIGSVGIAIYTRCSFRGGALGPGFYSNCCAGSGISVAYFGTITMDAGAYVASVAADQFPGLLVASGDLYVTGDQILIGQRCLGSIFIVAGGISTGIQIQDMTIGFFVGASNNGTIGASGLIWGNGNAGFGLVIGPGVTFTVPNSAPLRPSVTGTSGDFAFTAQNGGALVQVARAWDDGSGSYTANVSTTWAHFAAAIGGPGFGFQAHSLATNAAIIGA